MKKFLILGLVLFVAGCSTGNVSEDLPVGDDMISSQFYDPSITEACGEFELREDRHYGSNGYYLCANETGECEYKVSYFVANDGCEYDQEEFPYGDPECDEVNIKRISESGEVLYDGEPDEMEYFNCSSVEQESFNEKVGGDF